MYADVCCPLEELALTQDLMDAEILDWEALALYRLAVRRSEGIHPKSGS
jgi:hypothetical protein